MAARTIRHLALPVACIAATLAVIAAGADGKPKKAFSACSLLKAPEAASALGEGVQRSGGSKTPTGAYFCNWYGNDTHALQETLVLIAAKSQPKTRFKLYKRQFHLNTAVGSKGATDGSAVAVYNAKGFVYIGQGGWSGKGDLGKLKGLAKTALSRIR